MQSSFYIGSRVGLISQSNIRYEGFLSQIDPINNNLTLQYVRFFGTEGRNLGNNEINGSNDIYPSLTFNAADIKDIQVLQSQMPYSQMQTPSLPADPAIITSSSQQTSAPGMAPPPGFGMPAMPAAPAAASAPAPVTAPAPAATPASAAPTTTAPIATKQRTHIPAPTRSPIKGIVIAEGNIPPKQPSAAPTASKPSGKTGSAPASVPAPKASPAPLPAPAAAAAAATTTTTAVTVTPAAATTTSAPSVASTTTTTTSTKPVTVPTVTASLPLPSQAKTVVPSRVNHTAPAAPIPKTNAWVQRPEPTVVNNATAPATTAPVSSQVSVQRQQVQPQQQYQHQQRYPQSHPHQHQHHHSNRGHYHHHRGGAHHHHRRPHAPGVQIPKEDFDFEASNAKFEQEVAPELEKLKLEDGTDEKKEEEAPYYNKESSFFDSISCDITDKLQGKDVPVYVDRANEKKQNMETFGRANPYRGRGRGGRGGYRGRGYNNNNYNYSRQPTNYRSNYQRSGTSQTTTTATAQS